MGRYGRFRPIWVNDSTCPKSDTYSACLGNVRVGPGPLFPPFRNAQNSTRDLLSMVHRYVFVLKDIIYDYSLRACFSSGDIIREERGLTKPIVDPVPDTRNLHISWWLCTGSFVTFYMNESPIILTQSGLSCFPGCA
jgi:hypothetical protein